MKKLGIIISEEKNKFAHPDRNVSREFQVYGYDLAGKLGDLRHKALYIKLAKEEPRELLEQALRFAIDYQKAKSKGKLFMFKLQQLKATSLKSCEQNNSVS